MRAAAFIRYQGAHGLGHVGWAFDFNPPHANAGSVENHSGHFFTPAKEMGFWTDIGPDPVAHMRELGYDDVKYIDIPNGDPILAYRTVLWIQENAYRAWLRNCEDDVYDVLRAFGVDNLTPPSIVWFPNTWFQRFRGQLAHVAEFQWNGATTGNPSPALQQQLEGLTPWHPTWRRPWHLESVFFQLGKLIQRPAEFIRSRLSRVRKT